MWNGFLIDMHDGLVKLTMFAETYSLLFDAQISFRLVVLLMAMAVLSWRSFSNSELISEFFDHYTIQENKLSRSAWLKPRYYADGRADSVPSNKCLLRKSVKFEIYYASNKKYSTFWWFCSRKSEYYRKISNDTIFSLTKSYPLYSSSLWGTLLFSFSNFYKSKKH